MNYFLASGRNNPLLLRSHQLLLALWAADEGKTSIDGMHRSPLLKGVPLMRWIITTENQGSTLGESTSLTDYIIQSHAMSLVMGLVDEEDDWNGPKYVAEHVYGIECAVGSQLIYNMTGWDGKRAFDLMSLSLPKEGEVAITEQEQAKELVEACLQKSFGLKLAHGLVRKVLGETLGLLWRKNVGSDDVPGTYAHWLRHGMVYWNPDEMPPALEFKVIDPFKRGPLLRED
ncbi:hypothetical protein M413DRAFT_444269 [Hebeloma cylindrosporum]|uniref:Uncharacterized protein n=1 Tax=Hebeloma cylindrosporum TaxID=76867 RepID=A0A0C2YNF7_HEBCY|nr:hypothetical protein M413DRAFT_444269 [Hebeloma cylindrosporum h7]